VVKRGRWIISESGLQSLAFAGITTGWLRAWLHAAGAEQTAVSLLAAGDWQREPDQWRLFFATENELDGVRATIPDTAQVAFFELDNPARRCSCYRQDGVTSLLLPLGDIVFQRHSYLSLLNETGALQSLSVYADELHPLPLEPGLSASGASADTPHLLNSSGLLIEEQLIALLRRHSLMLRSVESCTAGMIAARLCRVPGASDVFDRGWVTYSNAAKEGQVGVPAALIDQYGAVSEPVVRAMAEGGAVKGSVCVAVSGIAGPGGGSADKPVGTVWIAVSIQGAATSSRCLQLSGARFEIQAKSVVAALQLVLVEVEKAYR